jgi:hypothetical protein
MNVALPLDWTVEFTGKLGPFGINARTVGAFTVVELYNTLKGRHCDNVPFNVYGSVGMVMSPVGKHATLSEGWILITSDTRPVPTPFLSSSEATKVTPAAKGKNVTTAPVLVLAFHASREMGIMIGFVELNGTTVNIRGIADGGIPPMKETLKGPHCVTEENVIVLKARTPCDP